MRKRTVILIAGWTLAFIIALLLDAQVAAHVRSSGLAKFVQNKWWAEALKMPGQILFTAAVAVLLWLFRRAGWKCAVFVILTGIASGTNAAVKWIVGRTRPFKLPNGALHPFELHPFWHGSFGFFHQRDLSFPSGHECTAAALAAAMIIVWPRGAWLFICLAVVVGMERVAENAHYLSDVIGAAGFSILCVALLNLVFSSWMNKPKPQGFLVNISPPQAESGTLTP